MAKDISIDITDGNEEITLEDKDNANVEIEANPRAGSGTSDYNNLTNKPKINNVELTGNKTLQDLGIKQEYTADDIEFSDGETFQQKYNAGELTGPKGDTGDTGPQGPTGPAGTNGIDGADGEDGFSPSINVKTSTDDEYVLTITNKTGSFDTPNLKGDNGEDGISITTVTSGTTSQSDGYTITPITFNKSDGSNTTVNISAKNGTNGQDGQDGVDGTSVTCIKVADEETAIAQSTANTNNIYYW